MGIVGIDPTGLVPDSTKRRLFDSLIDFLESQTERAGRHKAAQALRNLRSDAEFRAEVDQALQRAAQRFEDEYAGIDREVLEALMRKPDRFWEAQPVREALAEMIRRPGTYLEPERNSLEQSFAEILPGFEPKRVNRAVAHYLSLLAEQVMVIPQLQPVYGVQLQKLTLEQGRTMVDALRDLQADQRQAMMALLDVVSRPSELTGANALALPEPPRVYHNLPNPDYVSFVGREQELARVHELLSPASRAWVVTIDGIGGIGKSALALEVAYHYLRDYDWLLPEERFQAIIWTSAKAAVLTADGIASRQQIVRTLDDIYSAIAVTLEREAITRSRPGEQHELVVNALTRQRTLLIVDNLETMDDEQVNAFLRELPAPTKAIVTTRHRIDVAYPVRLTEMPCEDGLILIAQECEKKGVALAEAQAEKLYNRTGGVPLAIVWSVAQMGYGYDVEAVLRRLGEPTGDIALFCFEGAVERIRGTDAHNLLMALSLFETDASREAVGFAAGLDKDVLSRDEGLVTLERLSLVNKRQNRFWMLPLTKEYVRTGVRSAADTSDLEARWIDYFARFSEEYGDENWNWMNYDWLLAEGQNILALAEWAAGVGRPEIVLKLHYPILRYLDIQGRWVEVIRYGQFLYSVAQSLKAKRITAWICTHWLSWLYGEQGDSSRSEKFAREGIALYREIGDKKGESFSLASLSRAYRKGGQFEESRKTVQEMLQLAQDIGFSDGVAAAHDQLGKIARDLSMWTDAKEYFESARALCERDDANLDMSLLMNIHGNLGWTEFHLGNPERGKELCERSLDFFRRIGGRGYTTALYCQLAAIELALGNRQKAGEHAKEALYWAERLQILRDAQRARGIFEQVAESESSDDPT